jgi:hypothetical protein
MAEALGELVQVALDLGVSYFVLRDAVIQGKVRGRRIEGHWFCEIRSARQWKHERARAERTQAEPAVR